MSDAAPGIAKRILVSVHDVTPKHFVQLGRIDDFLRDLGLAGCYSMLVVPDYWHRWPLHDHPEFQRWLRSRADEGVEMILHGYHHLDESSHTRAITRWKAGHFTAGEGEFLGLGQAEAAERLLLGRNEIERIVGKPVEGFIAPAWLCGDAAGRALGETEFLYTEDHWRVWCPRTGETLARSPVVSYASRSRARIASSLLWSAIAPVALAPARVVRLAIHPNDFAEERLIRSIQRALHGFLGVRRPCLYRDLIAAPRFAGNSAFGGQTRAGSTALTRCAEVATSQAQRQPLN